MTTLSPHSLCQSPKPEAQHPNSSAIHKLVGRLPHLSGVKRALPKDRVKSAYDPEADKGRTEIPQCSRLACRDVVVHKGP